MEPQEYGRTAAAEDLHFWFREARSIWRELLRHAPIGPAAAGPAGSSPSIRTQARPHRIRLILDAGCGTGGNLRAIESEPVTLGSAHGAEGCSAAIPSDQSAIGLDLSPIALGLARERIRSPLVRGSIGALPFREGVFDLVLCADVLYHEEVRDEAAALREFRRVLRPGGFLCVNVPAFDSLRSAHDRAMHTARRYSREALRARLFGAGLVPLRVIYWNGLLLIPAAIVRLFRRSGRGSEIGMPPRPLNALLWGVARCDAALALAGSFPAGLSVAALAQREDGVGSSQ